MIKNLDTWKSSEEREIKMTRKRLYDVAYTKDGTIRILLDPDTKIIQNDMPEYTSKMPNGTVSKIKRRVQAILLSINF